MSPYAYLPMLTHLVCHHTLTYQCSPAFLQGLGLATVAAAASTTAASSGGGGGSASAVKRDQVEEPTEECASAVAERVIRKLLAMEC